jgi:hypothetical protein
MRAFPRASAVYAARNENFDAPSRINGSGAHGAPAGAERGFRVPASDGDGESGGAKPPV